MATTVSVKGEMTWPIFKATAWALGSRQGFVGEGFGLDGQSYAAMPEAFIPGVKGTGIIWGAGAKEAVTDCAEPIAMMQPPVPEQAALFSQPPKVEGCVGVAARTLACPEDSLPSRRRRLRRR